MAHESSLLVQRARALPPQVRQSYLMRIRETDLHPLICRLVENMEAGTRCEITHGRDEYGRDIVVRRPSAFGSEYIAIVVKRGDAKGKISARTASAIDEIKSQGSQSISHPCKLKEIEFSTVDISSVWVMFFGNLTDNATQRIRKETPGLRLQPFPIGWLADRFADYYPEVFFSGATSTYLQDKVVDLETQHDLSRRPNNLSEWYISPTISPTVIASRTFTERLGKVLKMKRLSYKQFQAQLAHSRSFVLSAPPGFGKSTLLRKLALDLYQEALTDTASLPQGSVPQALHIPIFVPATSVAKYHDIDSFIQDHSPPADIRNSFSIACILVDALDEVPQEQQAGTLAFAQSVAKSLNCSLVVSARPVQVVRTLADDSTVRLPTIQLLPFEHGQAMRLIDRLVHDPEIVEILREGITRVQSYMALSPLSVSLLMDIAEAEREIPGTIGEIFDQYIDIALGRYDVERGIEVVFQYFIKKRLLSELAWAEFFQKNRLRIEEAEFDQFMVKYFQDRSLDADSIRRMKADIDRSGIIRFSDGAYFAHRSFLEFFIGLYLVDHGNEFPDIEKWLADTYFSDKWSDTVLHYFARKREILPRFLSEVEGLSQEDVDYHIRRFMIGRLLQAGWLSPSKLKLDGIDIGMASGPKLFAMISHEMDAGAPQTIPYGVMAGLTELSYSSRTILQEVSQTIIRLADGDSIDDFRNAICLLWANRTRIATDDVYRHADKVLAMMARLEQTRRLSVADKALGYLLLESIVENDSKRLRAISRRFTNLQKAQPAVIKTVLFGSGANPSRGLLR